ncbi:zinc finger BED domain-containing protein DAYSLEEPER-like [Gossypium arboreum]|uniref:zinc finger BED domain-containing protein DAYSLEEPER-like n=1 Tax=Gossypium arboreum TaxID=29729 RepID=UPI0022F19A27|nr:zinc finger BED domain-containing protein DAYSLEEPER-like [Gossypium arboreum]
MRFNTRVLEAMKPFMDTFTLLLLASSSYFHFHFQNSNPSSPPPPPSGCPSVDPPPSLKLISMTSSFCFFICVLVADPFVFQLLHFFVFFKTNLLLAHKVRLSALDISTIFCTPRDHGTSHLRRHLNSCLKKVNKDISQYTIATQPSLRGVPFIKNYKFDADECRKAISTFLVCDKHSFRTVEEPGFRYMMSIASPNFKNISRYTAARDVLMYYTKERDRVKEELAKAPGLICLSSDNWNSGHTNDEYICITAHWVDENWKLQKRIIRNSFRANRVILCDGAFFQVRCCAHILNLIVKAGLELADDVVGKIRNGIKYIKKPGTRRKRFYDVADKSFHLNVTKKLRQDVCVRWNSTYLMLESSLYYKDVLDYWGQRDKDYQIFALSNEEWRNVAILCKFLKVFYDVTFFSGSNYPTANLYFRGVWKVHKVLLDTVKGPYSFLTPMVKQMEEKFNKYWAEYSLILSCAAILDPRYKLNYVQYCFTTIYGIHASDFVETILSNLKLLFDDLDEHNVNSVDFGGDFDKSDDYKRYLNESSTRSEKSQLDIYLEEPELELNSQIDVLDYWSKSLVRYN